MHPRNNQVLANGPYFCLTPVYCAYPLPPCTFSYPEGSFISLQGALSPATWVPTPHSPSGDVCLFLFPAPRSLGEGQFRASCSYQKFTQYLAVEGESL